MQGQNNPPQAGPGPGVAIPLQMWSHHFDQLHMEMRANNAVSQIRRFDGEGHERFSDWLRDMEKAKLTVRADDERMRTLAVQTLSGPAAEFCMRIIKDDARMTWRDLRTRMRQRYSDLADAQYAKQTLRRLRQHRTESVQNFAERILLSASEAYPDDDLAGPVVQQTLVEVFVDGVQKDHIARKLIKAAPATLAAAVDLATSEQQAARTFDLRRGEEPMEIGAVGGTNPLSELTTTVNLLAENMAKLTTMMNGSRKQQQKAKKRANTEYQWAGDGQPICANCKVVGHYQRACPSNVPKN